MTYNTIKSICLFILYYNAVLCRSWPILYCAWTIDSSSCVLHEVWRYPKSMWLKMSCADRTRLLTLIVALFFYIWVILLCWQIIIIIRSHQKIDQPTKWDHKNTVLTNSDIFKYECNDLMSFLHFKHRVNVIILNMWLHFVCCFFFNYNFFNYIHCEFFTTVFLIILEE